MRKDVLGLFALLAFCSLFTVISRVEATEADSPAQSQVAKQSDDDDEDYSDDESEEESKPLTKKEKFEDYLSRAVDDGYGGLYDDARRDLKKAQKLYPKSKRVKAYMKQVEACITADDELNGDGDFNKATSALSSARGIEHGSSRLDDMIDDELETVQNDQNAYNKLVADLNKLDRLIDSGNLEAAQTFGQEVGSRQWKHVPYMKKLEKRYDDLGVKLGDAVRKKQQEESENRDDTDNDDGDDYDSNSDEEDSRTTTSQDSPSAQSSSKSVPHLTESMAIQIAQQKQGMKTWAGLVELDGKHEKTDNGYSFSGHIKDEDGPVEVLVENDGMCEIRVNGSYADSDYWTD